MRHDKAKRRHNRKGRNGSRHSQQDGHSAASAASPSSPRSEHVASHGRARLGDGQAARSATFPSSGPLPAFIEEELRGSSFDDESVQLEGPANPQENMPITEATENGSPLQDETGSSAEDQTSTDTESKQMWTGSLETRSIKNSGKTRSVSAVLVLSVHLFLSPNALCSILRIHSFVASHL